MLDLKPHFVVYHGGWHSDDSCFIWQGHARDLSHAILIALVDEFEVNFPPEARIHDDLSDKYLHRLIDTYIKPDCDLREMTVVMIGEGHLPKYVGEFDTDSILGLNMPKVNAPYTAPLDFVDWNHNERY